MTNVIKRTDSYKWTHWKQYPEDVTNVHSYYEARLGAAYPETVFFGLQPLLQSIAGSQVTAKKIKQAKALCDVHLGPGVFNENGWNIIRERWGGKLPLEIRAVDEGTPVPIGNVMMTVTNTDGDLPWLTNAVESLLTHVWHPCAVATVSRGVKLRQAQHMDRTVGNRDGLEFMLHDFGYRGAVNDEAAAIGGAGHLLNFLGTDTVLAMDEATVSYDAPLGAGALSVPATEHSVMTADGREGEFALVDRLLDQFPTGILSIVIDSYDALAFVDYFCSPRIKAKVMARDGKVVLRPDSVTPQFQTPPMLMVEILKRLWAAYGGTQTLKGYNLLDGHIGTLWGDGLSPKMIDMVLTAMADWGFATSNAVFGMGGGLHQKGIDRDLQRIAFKASAMKRRDGEWEDVFKDPLDSSKRSKAGVLALIQGDNGFETVKWSERGMHTDLLRTRFLNGKLINKMTFEACRNNAAIPGATAGVAIPSNAEVVR